MKNTLKISGIIALAAVIGFFMTACPDDKGGPAEPKSFITVTGMPPEYNGMIGAVKLFPPESSEPAVFSTEEKISGDSVTLPLFNWKKENPWTGNGSYSITFFIFKDRTAATGGQKTYTVKTEITITEANTAIEWTSFKQN